ncbi:hypothetical protein [Pectinatus frisingensis]|uniref:hypothetical protein n=1 Tax=Pectinatus frisingensis TaxID=865 RepID=UPI0018C51595|nr:hypothetical protein [Pectinatus frisingensis]
MDTSKIKILTRPLTDSELDYIVERAVEERARIGSPLLFLTDLKKFKKSLRQIDKEGQLRVWWDGSKIIGLLAFDVGYTWWTSELLLSEQFVFCIDPEFKGFSRIAIRELDNLARIFNCKFIVAGNFFMDKPAIVSNAYKKGGFELTCPSYIKIVGGLKNG